MDRTSMLTLHQSLGDWTHVGTLPSRKKQCSHGRLFGLLSTTLDRLDADSVSAETNGERSSCYTKET